ncbi:MAG: redoxin domain-containing protein [Bacteroidetes bacterium]|jgi:peroxiredoxin|nr:redoxin domain-containing protein [Bacteroidota bacterium]
MKFRILYILPILLLLSCVDKPREFTIKGTIKDAREGMSVILTELRTDEPALIDSVKTNSAGEFTLKGIAEHVAFYKLSSTGRDYITLIVKPGDDIEVIAQADQLGKDYIVYGSEDSKLVNKLTARQQETMQKISELGNIYQENLRTREREISDIKMELNKHYQTIVEEHKKFSIQFIQENSGSLASLMALYQSLGPRKTVFNPVEDLQYFKMVDSTLRQEYPESEPVKNLNAEITRITEYAESQAHKEQQLAQGKVPPDIALPNPDGDTITLSSLQGKYVLLDFWASWCKPCRVENPNLVENYNEFKEQGLTIYQVSLDKSREEWIKAIQKDNLDWYHVSDLKFWSSPVVNAYGITGIPANFLLNPQGEIIAKDLRGPQLEAKLNEIFEES